MSPFHTMKSTFLHVLATHMHCRCCCGEEHDVCVAFSCILSCNSPGIIEKRQNLGVGGSSDEDLNRKLLDEKRTRYPEVNWSEISEADCGINMYRITV
jgi:hypothetical protein